MGKDVLFEYIGKHTIERMSKTYPFQLSRMLDEILYSARETDCDYTSTETDAKVWKGWITLGPKEKYMSNTEIPDDVKLRDNYFDALAALRETRDYLELIALKQVT